MKLKLCILLIFLAAATTFARTNDEAELKSLVRQLNDAQTNYDPQALERLLAADYIEISPAGEFDPREKVLGFYKPELKPPAGKMTAKVEADEFSIRRYDDFAVVIARLNYTVTSEGKTLPPRAMRATFVCRKEKGVWKIVSAQFTGIRPPAAPKPQQ